MAWVLTNDHDSAVTADHFALVANLLDAWIDLHRFFLQMFRGVLRGCFLVAAKPGDLPVAEDNASAGEVVRG